MEVLSFVEIRAGKIRPAGYEALTVGRRLADATGGKLTALATGIELSQHTDTIAQYGPDLILLTENKSLENYTPEGYREAVIIGVKESAAELVIMSGTAMGRDLAPIIAAKLDSSLLPDVTDISVVDNRLQAVRPVYGGRCQMTIAAEGNAVVSLRPKAFPAQESESKQPECRLININLDGIIKSKFVELVAEQGEKLDVTEADVIVSGGRGLKGPENFELIEELAAVLKGSVGASRAVVDLNWRPHSEQVGQTGKVVSPTLYIAVGISGAIQHLAGMRTSKVIVAINKDPDAPIFKIADYGIVGDALKVVPELTRAIRESV